MGSEKTPKNVSSDFCLDIGMSFVIPAGRADAQSLGFAYSLRSGCRLFPSCEAPAAKRPTPSTSFCGIQFFQIFGRTGPIHQNLATPLVHCFNSGAENLPATKG